MGFLTPVDIANRALQHCGASRIDPTLGFNEDSKNAQECSFAYDKLRLAELRRNIWRFAIKTAILRPIDATTMLLTPALWSATPSYFQGSIVSTSDGQIWISQIQNNFFNQPETSVAWEEYFGTMTAPLFQPTVSYSAGELVYTTPGDGTNRVYISLVNGNSDVPSTPTAWSPTVTYQQNQVVTFSSVAYMSLLNFNINQTPTNSAPTWDAGTSYSIGAAVTGTLDGVRYISTINGNIGNDPMLGVNWTNTGILTPWTTVFTGGAGSLKWRQIGGAEFPFGATLTPINLIYPITTGTSVQVSNRNVYHLPANFLRQAPSDPKGSIASALGSPTNSFYNDWLFQGDYFTSQMVDPLVMRFVADITDVRRFDPMFCEGLGARMGYEICEIVTQSSAKKAEIAKAYDEFMGTARTVNAIEIGAEDAPMDEYLACRY